MLERLRPDEETPLGDTGGPGRGRFCALGKQPQGEWLAYPQRQGPDQGWRAGTGTGLDRGVQPPQAADSWKFDKIFGRMSLLGNGSR